MSTLPRTRPSDTATNNKSRPADPPPAPAPAPSRTLSESPHFPADRLARTTSTSPRPLAAARFRWWLPGLALGLVSAGLLVYSATSVPGTGWLEVGTAGWWVLATTLHLPYLVILFFVAGGLVERLGFYWRGRAPEPAGRLPAVYPTVCVQLPMFNEHAVAQRIIEAASRMTWPTDRLSVQVLDDSTDFVTRELVEAVCARVRATTGVNCYLRHRSNRQGYKAGALEAGRQATEAEFLVIFDADFVPPQDFLLRTMPHFYRTDGEPDVGLGLVQAQWGHLNHSESTLTRAQSLWVDDHHTLQMSWRSAAWGFVNFTGTAGVWRASAIEAAGGWRAESLVEDCELSFRQLFAGYRTKFVKEIVVPAELPATVAAYKSQQKRWTQGWAQLQRMHLATLLFRFRSTWFRRLHLFYHMCIAWQWPAWTIWLTLLPFLIHTGLWFGSFGLEVGAALYLVPNTLGAVVAAAVASLETKHTYRDRLTPAAFLKRLGRIVPHLIINTGMLPHQFCAFAEGLFGPLHSEFERTPKTAAVSTGHLASAANLHAAQANAAASGPVSRMHTSGAVTRPALRAHVSGGVKVRWPYVLTEGWFVAYQLAWGMIFAANGLVWCALGAAYLVACVVHLNLFQGGELKRFASPATQGAGGSLPSDNHRLAVGDWS